MNDIELKTILLVEDEAIIALVEKKTLEKLGYNVIHASSGEKAVDIVKAGTRVDLILMDIDLGSGIDGTTAAEMILGTRDIPLVFLSSHTEPEIVEKTEGITSYGYIVKNSGETVLSAAIRMAFRLFEAKLKVQSHLNQQEVLVDILLEFHKRMNHPFEELMDYAIEVSLKLTESAFSFAGLMNEDESVMTIHAWSAGAMESCSIDKTPIKFPIPEAGVWGECLRQRKPVIINNYNDYAGKNGYPEGHVPITTFMAVPVFDGNRITAIGAVANKNSGYEMSDVRSLISLYEKLWEILRRKESETSLRESNERFKALHNASFGGITIHDKGIIFECNQGLADMTGYTSDELIGMDGLLLIAEKSRGLVMENILSGYEKPYEAFGLRKNGEEFPMRLEARNVPYKGEMVRTVEFRDITDIKKSEENLLKRLSYENMVAGISSLSLSEFNIDRFMSAVIDNLGETTRSSRAYIFEYRQDDFTINNTFEWCAPGITPQIDELQNIPADTITWWIDTLKRGENIRFEDIEDIPDEAAKEMLRPQGILSILVIPVFVDKKFYGFIGLDDCLNRNLWAEEDVVILESVTRIISGYMESRNSRLMLKEKAVLLKNITDNMLDLVALTDLKGNFKFAGKSHNILGYEPDYLIGRNVMEFVHPEDSVHVAEGFAGWLEGKEESARAEYRYRREDGTYIWLETVGRLIRDDEENVREIVFSSRDVTEKKKTEAELRKLSVALNQSPSCIVITGTDGTIEYVNPKFEELTGYSIDEAVGRNPSMLQSGSTPDVVYRELWDTINSGEVWRGNFQNRKKNGEKYWEFATIAPILNQQGETINFMAIKEDITERKKAEERISTLLQGKELLLKESHHRVKNNMNTVYGMLYMQAEELEEQKSRSIIKDAAWRVQSMMLLYDKLYQSESINELNIKDYIPPLIEEIAGIFDPRVQVKRKIIVDDIVLNAKTISALGIIINELITNSMKYAFNNVSDGLIYLEVAQKDNEVTVIYHDNGPGLPESFSFDDSEGFGMQLINMLVRQINGTIEVEKGESGRIIIRFRN